MNQKKAKKLRKAVKAQGLPPSKLMQHIKTGQIIVGQGEKALYKTLKKRAAA